MAGSLLNLLVVLFPQLFVEIHHLLFGQPFNVDEADLFQGELFHGPQSLENVQNNDNDLQFGVQNISFYLFKKFIALFHQGKAIGSEHPHSFSNGPIKVFFPSFHISVSIPS